MQKLVTTNQIKVHPFSSSKLNSNCEIITNFKHGFQIITLNPKAHLSIPIIQHCFSNKYVINMQQMSRNLVPCLWQVQITFPLTIQTINTTIQSLNKELIVSCNSCSQHKQNGFSWCLQWLHMHMWQSYTQHQQTSCAKIVDGMAPFYMCMMTKDGKITPYEENSQPLMHWLVSPHGH